MPRSRSRCAFSGCTNYKSMPGLTMFCFPKDPDRMYSWRRNCNNADLLSYSDRQMSQFQVCEKHFDNDSFMNYEHKKLVPTAIPTLDANTDDGNVDFQVIALPFATVSTPPVVQSNILKVSSPCAIESSLRLPHSCVRYADANMSTQHPAVSRDVLEGTGMRAEIKKEAEEDDLANMPDFEHVNMDHFQGTEMLSEVKEEPKEDSPVKMPEFEHLNMDRYQGGWLPAEVKKEPEEDVSSDPSDFEQPGVENYECPAYECSADPQQDPVGVKSATTNDEEREVTDVTESSSSFVEQLVVDLSLKTECPSPSEDLLEVDPLGLQQEKVEVKLSSECNGDISPKKAVTETVQSSARLVPSPKATETSFTHIKADGGINIFKCNQCEKVFAKKRNLRYHLFSHSSVRPFKCLYCEKSFTLAATLTNHTRTHTGERPFSCSQCDKSFTQSVALKRHLRTHTGERTFNCFQCKKTFARSSNLKVHMRRHTGVEECPFNCRHCDKIFTSASTLRKHMRTHTGERPFSCLHCGKSFTLSSTLRNHTKTHSGERPFNCPQCDKSFGRSSHLQVHMRRHTGERPFNCVQCDKMFTTSFDLKRHTKTHMDEGLVVVDEKSNSPNTLT